jgi:hypothetical protein
MPKANIAQRFDHLTRKPLSLAVSRIAANKETFELRA